MRRDNHYRGAGPVSRIVGFCISAVRVGERAVAYMVVKPDASIDLPQVTAFLAEKKVARSYFPERVEILPEMPMTATGKI